VRTTVKMALTSWDEPTDNYNYAQLAGNWSIVDFHDHSPGRGVPVTAGGLAAGAVTANAMAAASVGPQNLTAALAQDLGINSGSVVGRGVTNVAAAQTTSGTSFGFLSTHDEVTGITLATNGLIKINYLAQVKVSAGTGQAGLFINPGSGYVALNYPSSNNTFNQVSGSFTATHISPIVTNGNTLTTIASGSSDSTFVTTGMALPTAGGSIIVMAAAGTYSIGVQYLNSAGTTTAQNRTLWIETTNFA
jgi:hypothetical protein